jgi:hypothetical protein
MQAGMPSEHLLADFFEHLHLGMADFSGTHASPWPVNAILTEEALCNMLHCHETMPATDVLLPLGPAHHSLVLPGWFREKAGSLTGTDWARLCDLGVSAAVAEVEREREGGSEDCEMPELDLSFLDEGFVW